MIETKQEELLDNNIDYIEDLLNFGWQRTEQTREGSVRVHHNYQILARETTKDNYNVYRRYEVDYENAKSELKVYDEMEFSTVLLLLICFIVPGVLYIAYKLNQKANINSHNNDCKSKMQEAVKNAKNIK